MKGTPFTVTSKIGLAKKSSDPEFDDYNRSFVSLEDATAKLIKETKAFNEAVTSLFNSSSGFSTHFATLFEPISGEYDLIGKHPDSGRTIRNVAKYQAAMEEMKSLIAPEIELIESRILGPAKEYQSVLKLIRKSITKRDHKLTDYDRFNNSLTKLRDKKDKTLSDEKNLFKMEQDFEVATSEYEFINTALKQDLPRFLALSTQFIDPLFNSLFYMQLNIYYLLLEKMNSIADEGKYEIGNLSGAQIAEDYESKRTDAYSVIENLGIIKRIISVSRLVQSQRAQAGVPSLNRASSVATSSSSLRPAAPPSRSISSASSYKKAPPPPPSLSQAPAPPPYSPAPAATSQTTRSFAAPSASVAAAAKRPPPPPPPLKPKPKPTPQIQYVVALYDFQAQADGDLSFNAGDRIELVKRTESTDDWWTGRLNGAEGVFPGNYVQDT